jgi:hypothetical protein
MLNFFVRAASVGHLKMVLFKMLFKMPVSQESNVNIGNINERKHDEAHLDCPIQPDPCQEEYADQGCLGSLGYFPNLAAAAYGLTHPCAAH